MTPWTMLAWIVLAILYLAACCAFWLACRLFGWPEWPPVAVGLGAPFLALLFASIKRLLSVSPAQPATTPGLPVLTPAMAALVPPRELAKRWDDLVPLLGKEKLPVFLAVGEDDAVRNRLWLAAPECRYARDEASGLAFAVYPDAVWIDVPAAFVAPPPSGSGRPAATAGAPGLWEELVAFLPKLPGSLGGVLVMVDPLVSREESGGNAIWLREKLDRLYSRHRKRPPAVWQAATRLERFPGGGRLLEKLAASGDSGKTLLAEALGGAPIPSGAVVGRSAFASCLESLRGGLSRFILGSDAGGGGDRLVREAHLVRDNLDAIGANPGLFCEALAGGGPVRRAELGGRRFCCLFAIPHC